MGLIGRLLYTVMVAGAIVGPGLAFAGIRRNETSSLTWMRAARLQALDKQIRQAETAVEQAKATLDETTGCHGIDVLCSRCQVEHERLTALARDQLKYDAEASSWMLLFDGGKQIGTARFDFGVAVSAHIQRVTLAEFVRQKRIEAEAFVMDLDARLAQVAFEIERLHAAEDALAGLRAERDRVSR